MPKHSFHLPPEEQVITRNRAITMHYAQLYQSEPQLFKWAGMAAFASFHIGEKMQMWNWKKSGIKTFATTCAKKNRSIEDDFQIIRILNNSIFIELGWIHRAFSQMDYEAFKALLVAEDKDPMLINAFENLNIAKKQLIETGYTDAINDLVWKANTEILWHEQSKVVQPMFNKLTDIFSRAMTLFASFDYKVNHHETNWRTSSRFIIFMLYAAIKRGNIEWLSPELTNLQHRWYWILEDILKKWRAVESNVDLMNTEIKILASIENRNQKNENYN